MTGATWALAIAGVLLWAGATLLLDGRKQRRERRSLAKRLLPYRQRSVGDEAEEWLRHTRR